VYHGTESTYSGQFGNIDLGRCSQYTDFGHGFYTTSNYHQALNLARKKVRFLKRYEKNEDIKPMVVTFQIDTEKLKRLDGIIFEGYVKEWIEFVYNNRIGLKFAYSDFHKRILQRIKTSAPTDR
jgi:hypothetical protein